MLGVVRPGDVLDDVGGKEFKPVLTVLVPDVRVPTLTVWGLSVRKSRTQLQREGVRPRMRSFSASLVGWTVLNAEL